MTYAGARWTGSGVLVRLGDPEAQRKLGRELQTADRLAATRLTGIALTFTVASAVFYGVAFLWMLTYRAESEKSGAATTG